MEEALVEFDKVTGTDCLAVGRLLGGSGYNSGFVSLIKGYNICWEVATAKQHVYLAKNIVQLCADDQALQRPVLPLAAGAVPVLFGPKHRSQAPAEAHEY